MKYGIIGKTVAALGGLLLLHQAALAQEACGVAAGVSCNSCQWLPPFLRWCHEGAPRIRIQHGCPKPICNPCATPNWGYYQSCWAPWPFQPDTSHCRAPTSQQAPLMPPAAASAPGVPGPVMAPRKGGV